jgi:hypothetical protein
MSGRHTTLPLLTRLTALASTALVLLLTILADSPQWHAWLHAGEHTAPHAPLAAPTCPAGHHHSPGESDPALPGCDDQLCVITQFAQSQAALLVAPAPLTAQPFAVCSDPLVVALFCAPSAPAHLLPPCCGPPLV